MQKTITIFLFFCACNVAVITGFVLEVTAQNTRNDVSALTFFQEKEILKSSNPSISIELNDVLMEEALMKIGEKAKAGIYFDSELIPEQSVRLHFYQTPLSEILKELLEGTELEVYTSGRNIFLRSKNQTDSASVDVVDEITQIVQETITGRVTDLESGEALPGVNILIVGTSSGTSTAADGTFQLNVASLSDTLLVSYIGYQRKEVPINGRTELDIQLQQQQVMGDAVVVVGYGTQERASLTSSISSVSGQQITAAPVSNISSSVAGRIPGILSMQDSGQPGNDNTTLRIRGIGTMGNADPLIVVDGIPRGFNNLDPNEIESITVLKDAAAIAPYGMSGANGVILVTTKRGREGQISMNYNAWMGFQRPTRYPRYLDAYDTAVLLNTANENVGNQHPFSEQDLELFRNGTSPDTHHNHDWIREIVNFSAPMTNHNLTLSGGSDRIRYFSSLGYLFQEGIVDVIDYSRYTIAANVDIDATPNTTVSLDIRGRVQEENTPGGIAPRGIFNQITKWPAFHPLQYSNGHAGTNLIPSIYESGYQKDNGNNFQSQLTIEQYVPAVPGLSLKGVAGYDRGYSHLKHWETGFTYYNINDQGDFSPVSGGLSAPSLNERFSQNQQITLQGIVNYRSVFRDHHISGLGVAEMRRGTWNNLSVGRRNYPLLFDEIGLGPNDPSDWSTGGASGENAQVGFVGRLAYHYDYKYMVEFSGRYDGHYYFAPGHRFAFFPAVSVGWTISEENFMQNRIPWLDHLKIRASAGTSGNLAGSAFQYLGSYSITDSYVFGGSQTTGVFESREPNPNITWETSRKINVGLESRLWQGRFGIEADVFWERRSNMLLQPDVVVPAEYGIGLSQVNAGIMENRGIEFSINSYNHFNQDFQFNAGFNFTFAQNKMIEMFETDETYNDPNRRRTGRPWNSQFGFIALGFFQSEQEIEEHATQFGNVQPGDIKYKDVNGDGVINSEDQVFIAGPRFPEIIFGFTKEFAYKNFDLQMHWQGATRSKFRLHHEAAYPFFNGAKAMTHHQDFWTPDNRNAANPRVTPEPNTNTEQFSTFWLRDGSYLRLKTLDIGYHLPQTITQVIGLRAARVYVSGQNLLTFSHIDFFDPEMSNNRGRYYFQQKVFSFGVNLDF